jgi:hypothetical protein
MSAQPFPPPLSDEELLLGVAATNRLQLVDGSTGARLYDDRDWSTASKEDVELEVRYLACDGKPGGVAGFLADLDAAIAADPHLPPFYATERDKARGELAALTPRAAELGVPIPQQEA